MLGKILDFAKDYPLPTAAAATLAAAVTCETSLSSRFPAKAKTTLPWLQRVSAEVCQHPEAHGNMPPGLSIDCANPAAPKVTAENNTIYRVGDFFRAERVEGAHTQYCTLLLPDRLYTVHSQSECKAIVDAVRGPLAKYLTTGNGKTGA